MTEELEQVETTEEEKDGQWDSDWDEDENDLSFSWDWSGTESWAWGGSLVLIGVLYLLNNFGATFIRIQNWWAIFILAPGLSMLARALRRYQETGKATRGSRRAGIWGIITIGIALSFLFGMGWAIIWPALLIAGGVYLLALK